MTKELVCISCPNGCRLNVTKNKNGEITVTGNECKLGVQYAKQELLDPRRIITYCIPLCNGDEPLLPVKTDKGVPKDSWRKVVNTIRTVKATAPISCGECLVTNLAGTGVSLIASRTIEAKD